MPGHTGLDPHRQREAPANRVAPGRMDLGVDDRHDDGQRDEEDKLKCQGKAGGAQDASGATTQEARDQIEPTTKPAKA